MKNTTPSITGDDLLMATKGCQQLINNHKTLILSTVSFKGKPEISYAPFVRGEDGTFYIFISELAHHTANLRANPACAILFAALESETKNLFARERALLNCEAAELTKESAAYDYWLDRLQERFGNTVDVIRRLSDFHLFSLTPHSGQYTAGFAMSFTMHADGSLSHIVVTK